jgi:hypothetical protein
MVPTRFPYVMGMNPNLTCIYERLLVSFLSLSFLESRVCSMTSNSVSTFS